MLSTHLLLPLALLIPLATSQDDYTTSLNFKLITYLKTTTDLTPSINNYALNYNKKTTLALLTPRKRNKPETSYYINGTYFDSFHSIATLWTDDSKHAINIANETTRDAQGRRIVYFSKTGQKGWVETTPAGCADVIVSAECVVDGTIHPLATPAYCCRDVAVSHCSASGPVPPPT
ncbi:hypothetical protein GLAREA_04681 [Glarea lozoyensis ATCC 20868]|uniref:Uncharacterized protein n=1 Tax=Glarea lozoyensis (strain ATCC 20868 / MF5171) TaxID=1116229 RepID=S3CQB8_GLAL2|nr:uncharacterized protein GLAREA_04681 [Glarea lozoyensis ATCC 20868]EPE27890.1 hypothetical protein GLAREA_04681 [Glarea lozoyensis ATCC 20868]